MNEKNEDEVLNIDKEQLVVFKTKKGKSADELRDVLKEGQEMIREGYLLWMSQINLLGDSSFVIELDGNVYLISYYAYAEKPKEKPTYTAIENMNAYQKKLSTFFDSKEPLVTANSSNSFWSKLRK